MARFDYKVTTEKGNVFTRSSDNHYSHAVVFTLKGGHECDPNYANSLQGAVKRSGGRPDYHSKDSVASVKVYPVEITKDRGPCSACPSWMKKECKAGSKPTAGCRAEQERSK